MTFFDTPLFQWVLLPVLLFCSRIVDVSIGTVRIMFVAKGIRKFAAVFAFFEVLIWLFTIRQVLANISNPLHYAAYAAGFATGTFVGMLIEQKMSLGNVIIRVIAINGQSKLAGHLRDLGWRVTDIDAVGNEGPVRIIFLVIKRKELATVTGIIKKFNPNAFYSIEDVRFVSRDALPVPAQNINYLFRRGRKGK